MGQVYDQLVCAYHFYDSEWVDISDYVIECEKIPFADRNRNFEPRTRSVKMSISERYPNTISVDEKIKFEITLSLESIIAQKHVFSSYVDECKKSETKASYEILLQSSLGKLADKRIMYTTALEDLIAEGDSTQYRTNDNESPSGLELDNIQLLWLLQCLFANIGLTLDVTSVTSTAVEIGVFNFDGTNYTYYLPDLAMDKRAFYFLGQLTIGGSLTVQDPESSPTYFDFVKVICQAFNLILQCTDQDTYKLVKRSNKNTYLSFDNDFFLSLNSNKQEPMASSYAYQVRYGNNDFPTCLRRAYYDSTLRGPNIQDELPSGDDSERIDWIESFALLFRDKSSGASDGDVILNRYLDPHDYCMGNYISDLTDKWEEKTYELVPQLSLHLVSEAYYNFENQSFEVKEEKVI